MNKPRYVLATIAAFVFVVAFEMFWHGFLMNGMYEATASVWRPKGEHYMIYMFSSQFLFAAALALLYTCVGKHLTCKKGIQFGFLAGLLLAMPQLGTYCYLPIPLKISLLWMAAAFLKCLGGGVVIASVYKEK